MRKWLIGLALLNVGLIVALIATEFVLNKFSPHYRAIHKDVFDGKYGLSRVKDIAERKWKLNHNMFVKMNSHGFRDKERTYGKKEGVFRILVLGDSMTEALQVPPKQSYPHILETSLNSENGQKFEVINLAVPGFNTAYEYLMFNYLGLKYQPDLVILPFFIGDDVRDNSSVIEKALVDSDDEEINNNLISILGNGKVDGKALKIGVNGSGREETKRDKGGLPHIIKRASVSLFPNIYYSLVDCVKDKPGITAYHQVYAEEYSPRWQNDWNVTKSLISGLANELRMSDTEFLVVVIPNEFEFRPDKWNKVLHKNPKMKTVNFDVKKPERILKEFLETNNIDYLLLRPKFEEYSGKTGKDLYLYDGLHWNSDGHALVAQLIYRKLRDYELTP